MSHSRATSVQDESPGSRVEPPMANHVVNLLHINGTEAQVEAVRTLLASEWEEERDKDTPRPIDFSKIIPMPPSLDLKSGIEAMVIKQEMQGRGDSFADMRERPGFDQAVYEQCLENVRLYGAPTWYEWSIANWGTKWNAYQQKIIEPNLIEFQTAWNAPRKFLQMLAARFPDVEFVVEYADEDFGSNCGTLIYRDGFLVSDEEPDDPKQFAYRLHRVSDEEITEWEAEEDEEDDD